MFVLPNWTKPNIAKLMPEIYDGLASNGKIAVAFNTLRSSAGDRLEYEYFVLDGSLKAVFKEPTLRTPECKLTFLAEDGSAVGVERFTVFEPDTSAFDDWVISPYGLFGDDSILVGHALRDARNANAFLVSTVFFDTKHSGQKSIADVVRKVTLSHEELKQITSIRCELQFRKLAAEK